MERNRNAVMPAEAGTQCIDWAPAFAGVTS